MGCSLVGLRLKNVSIGFQCVQVVLIQQVPPKKKISFAGLFGGVQENTAQYYNPAPVCPASGFVLSSLSLPTSHISRCGTKSTRDDG